jgi:hypothetical protein
MYNKILDMQDEHVRVVRVLKYRWMHEGNRLVDPADKELMKLQIERIDFVITQLESEIEPPKLLGFRYRRGILTALASYVGTAFAAIFAGIASKFVFSG